MVDYTYTYTDAQLQAQADRVENLDDEFAELLAPNLIKTSQLVVEGRTGDPLPVFGVDTLYAIGAEVALGWFVVDSSVTLQLDANDNIIRTAGTGKLYYEFDIASGLTLASYFYSVMFDDGSEYTQTYGDDANGIVLTEPVAGTGRITIDPTVIPFKVCVVSEQVGRGAVLSVDDVERSARGGYLLVINANGSAVIWPDGRIEQAFRGSLPPNFPINFPVPFTGDFTQIKIEAMHSSISTLASDVFNYAGGAISLSQCEFTAFTQAGAYTGTGTIGQYTARNF